MYEPVQWSFVDRDAPLTDSASGDIGADGVDAIDVLLLCHVVSFDSLGDCARTDRFRRR
jgi:hypothetical protein